MGRSELEGKLPGSAFWQALHPEDRQMVRDVIERAMLEKQPYEYRARFALPDGREHLMYTRAKVILNSDGQVVRRFGVTQDITEKVQTEQHLSTTE